MTNKFFTWLQEDKKLLWLIILTTIVFRLPTLFIEVFNNDEPYYATAAMSLLQGGIPYVDFVDIKPPLIHSIYALTFKIFGTDIRYVHLVVIFVIFGTSYFLYKSLKLYSLKKAGLLAALFYGLFSTAFFEEDMWAANAEILMNLPMTLSIYFFLKGHIKNNFFSYFLSGLFVMIGVLIKQQAGLLYPLFFIVILYFSRKENWAQKLKKLLAQGSTILAGSLIPLALTLLLFASWGHLREFYIWTIKSNIGYIASSPSFLKALQIGTIKTFEFIAATLILWVLSIYGYRKISKISSFSKEIYFIFLFWAFLTFSAVMIGGRFWGHYYILFYPSLATLGGLGAAYFLSQLSQYSNKIKILFLAGIILPPLYFQFWGLTRYFTGDFIAARPFITEVTNAIEDELHNPQDRIFVWGLFPHFYYYTKHLPATRFIACDYLVPYWIYRFDKYKEFNITDMSPELKDYYEKNMEILLSDLNKYKPPLIIDVQGAKYLDNWTRYRLEFFPRLDQLIKKNYYLLKNIEGVTIYKRL